MRERERERERVEREERKNGRIFRMGTGGNFIVDTFL